MTPQEEAILILSQWEREATEKVRAKIASMQLGELFYEEESDEIFIF